MRSCVVLVVLMMKECTNEKLCGVVSVDDEGVYQ